MIGLGLVGLEECVEVALDSSDQVDPSSSFLVGQWRVEVAVVDGVNHHRVGDFVELVGGISEAVEDVVSFVEDPMNLILGHFQVAGRCRDRRIVAGAFEGWRSVVARRHRSESAFAIVGWW